MTVWRTVPGTGGKPAEYAARRHDSARQLWRDFGSVFAFSENDRRPGVVRWYEMLNEYMGWPPTSMSAFKIAAVQYGDKDFFINDTFSDGLVFHAGLISKMGEAWQQRVKDEVGRCEKLADAVGLLARALSRAAGGDEGTEGAKARLYAQVDQPFRRWLRDIDPETRQQAANEKQREWQREAQHIALKLGEELVRQSGEAAFIGRTVKEKNDVERHYSAPEAFLIFQSKVKSIYKEG